MIPTFSGKNYDNWAFRMKLAFDSYELTDIVMNGYTEPQDESILSVDEKKKLDENRQKSKRALQIIGQALDDSVVGRIKPATTAKQAWDILETAYQGTSKVKIAKLQALRREFENLQMKDSDSIDQFTYRVTELVNQIRQNGDELVDQKVVEKVLRSLPRKFDAIVVVIEESKDLTKYSMDELVGSLKNYEDRLNRNDNTSLEHAFKTQMTFGRGRGRGNPGFRGRGRGRNNFQREERKCQDPGGRRNQNFNSRESNYNQASQRYDKSKIQCYYCKKYGHFANECQKRQADMRKQNAHFSESSSETLFITCDVAQENASNIWFLDSGCSNHMTGNKGLFEDLNTSVKAQIKLGNDNIVEVMGKGAINVITNSGKKTIPDVYFVPGLKHNLISVGQLTQKGYRVSFENNVCTIFDIPPSKVVIARIKMTDNRMFPLHMKSEMMEKIGASFKASSQDQAWIWHLRYGHLNFKALCLLQRNEMVKGLPPIQAPISSCESCILGKQHRLSFPKEKSYRAWAPLEIVHTDLCGPMKTPSLGGSIYFLTFIDDYSRKTWVYFLKHKSETFDKFKEFKAFVEKQSGLSIKILRSDRGGEYKSNEFLEYCRYHGIKKQFTTSYTPQQNGVAERKNRTIMEMARSMLKGKNLSNEYWAEAVACAVYILNRSPTKIVRNMVPQEAWSGKHHSVSHFKVFGCIAYAHIPKQTRSKLDDKSEKCIFIGYDEQSKAYKLFNPITKKVIVSRDVVFKEEESWDGNIDKTITGTRILYEEQGEKGLGEQSNEQGGTPSSIPQEENSQRQGEQGETSSPQVSYDSNPTLESLRSRLRGKKTRSLHEIYDQGDRIDLQSNFALFTQDPIYFEDAIKEEHWINAMNEEMESIKKNDTWDLVDLPKEKECIGVKWVYKTKYKANGEVDKHKARLVAKGFAQEYGVDYNETFAPVARLDTIRMVLAIAAQHNWKVYQMDVKSAFLNGYLEEEVYVQQPPGYEVRGQEDKVYRLKKALYGLKQAPRAWYSRIDSYMIKNEFIRSTSEPTLYTKVNEQGQILIVCLYVDDLIYTGNLSIDMFKSAMKKEFEMTDLGLMNYFLGIEVTQNDKGIFICQSKYARDVLKRFRMINCSPVSTPVAVGTKLSREQNEMDFDSTIFRKLVGSLMYLTATRPDIMYGVSLISRFMDTPKNSHWQAGKRLLRYIAGTMNHGILYSTSNNLQLVGYTDSDFAGSIDDRKSTSGYAFHLGTGVVAWASKKQPIVTISSAEAEYVAGTSAACQAVWMRRILKDLMHNQEEPTTIYCDNKSTIALSKNHVFHKKTKHIDTRYHFIRELVNNGELILQHCRSNEQLADIFTKALAQDQFEYLREALGIVNINVISSRN
jgi:hypothetical protein